MEPPIISVMTTTMIATGSATRSPEKIFGSAAGNMTRRRMIARLAPKFRAVQIRSRLNFAESEITSHHDRIEAFEKGKGDL